MFVIQLLRIPFAMLDQQNMLCIKCIGAMVASTFSLKCLLEDFASVESL